MNQLNNLLREKRETSNLKQEGKGFSYNSPFSQSSDKNEYNNQTQPHSQYKPSVSNRDIARIENRAGLSVQGWRIVLDVLEFISDLFKGFLIVSGVLAANLADFIMGSIAISFLTNPEIRNYTFVNGFGFGAILSLGASAIQIFMWGVIQKRGISFGQIIKMNVPKDLKGFLIAAVGLWFIDTMLDLSPLFILMSNVFYNNNIIFGVLVSFVAIILFILCGFAEILTSNMRGMIGVDRAEKKVRP